MWDRLNIFSSPFFVCCERYVACLLRREKKKQHEQVLEPRRHVLEGSLFVFKSLFPERIERDIIKIAEKKRERNIAFMLNLGGNT